MAAEGFGVGYRLVKDQGVHHGQPPPARRHDGEQEDASNAAEDVPNHILNLLLPAPDR
jgi:hypothetical protein